MGFVHSRAMVKRAAIDYIVGCSREQPKHQILSVSGNCVGARTSGPEMRNRNTRTRETPVAASAGYRQTSPSNTTSRRTLVRSVCSGIRCDEHRVALERKVTPDIPPVRTDGGRPLQVEVHLNRLRTSSQWELPTRGGLNFVYTHTPHENSPRLIGLYCSDSLGILHHSRETRPPETVFTKLISPNVSFPFDGTRRKRACSIPNAYSSRRPPPRVCSSRLQETQAFQVGREAFPEFRPLAEDGDASELLVR